MEKSDDVLCVLLAARTLIDCEGWTQRTFVDWHGKFCAVGAVINTSAPSLPQIEARRSVADAVNIDVDRLTNWNDHARRTKAEVLEAFDLAIAAEEKRLG